MKQKRRKFSAEFKAKVALEAIKEQKSLAELRLQFEVNPVTLSKWKSEFTTLITADLINGQELFSDYQEVHNEKLYAPIEQLK